MKNNKAIIIKRVFYFQTITERVHVEKRYGPRRPVTSPDENRDIAAQIRGKIFIFSLMVIFFETPRFPTPFTPIFDKITT